jgi:hypothetical protein
MLSSPRLSGGVGAPVFLDRLRERRLSNDEFCNPRDARLLCAGCGCSNRRSGKRRELSAGRDAIRARARHGRRTRAACRFRPFPLRHPNAPKKSLNRFNIKFLRAPLLLQGAVYESLMIRSASNYAFSGLIEWGLAAAFIGGGVLGSALGARLPRRLARESSHLATLFATIVFCLALYMLARTARAW